LIVHHNHIYPPRPVRPLTPDPNRYDAVVEACGAKAVLPTAFKSLRVGGMPPPPPPRTHTHTHTHSHTHTHTHTHTYTHIRTCTHKLAHMIDLLGSTILHFTNDPPFPPNHSPAGTLVLVGLVHPDSELKGITAEMIIRKCATIVGVHNYTPQDLRETVPFVVSRPRALLFLYTALHNETVESMR
jgi:hypothetical protein